MRKLSAFLCLILLVSVGNLYATQTRVMTLGEVGHVVMDEDNIYTWPQTLGMYPNQGIVEIMGSSFYRTSGSFGFDNFTLSLLATEETWSNSYMTVAPLDQRLGVIYARELGGMPFGFNFSLYSRSHMKDSPTDKTEHTGMGFRVGAGLTLMDNLETFFNFGSLSWEEKNAAGATVSESNGGASIMLGARWWWEVSDSYKLIPYLTFSTESSGSKVGAADTTDDVTNIRLGIGNNHHVGDGVLLVHDMGINMMNRTVENGAKREISDWMFPYFRGGMEAPISDKFDFRVGVVKEWNAKTEKVGDAEESWGTTDTRLYIGASYNRGNFSVDANVDPGFFTRGPYLITGSAGDWATSVSMRYIWGE